MTFHALYEAGFVTTIPITPPDCPLAPGTKLRPQDRGKVPGLRNGTTDWWGFDWIKHETVPADLDKWTAIGAGVGLRTKDFPAVDVDVLDERLSALVQALVQERLGWAPRRVGRAPKVVLAYRTTEPFKRRRLWFRVPGMAKRQLVEVLGDGQQYVVEGLHAELRRPYVWDIELEAVGAAGLTLIDREQVEGMLGALRELLEREGCTEIELEGSGAAKGPAPSQEELTAPWEQIVEAVGRLPNTNEHFPSRTDYLTVGYAIKAAVGERGRELFLDWAEKWEGNADFPHGNSMEGVDSDWSRMKPPFQVGAPYLFELAQQLGGYRWAAEEFADIAEPMPEGGVVPGKRPVIQIEGGGLAEQIDKAEAALGRTGEVYQRGGMLVRIGRHDEHRALSTFPLVKVSAMKALTKAVHWQRPTRKEWVSIDCPPLVAEGLLADAGFWKTLPRLTGVIEAPTLRRDGSVLEKTGYDEASGLYLDTGTTVFDPVPVSPTRADALAALDMLKEVLCGFPFVNEESRAVMLAELLTACVRRSLRSAPMFLHDAPKMGSGKSLLASVAGYLAIGRDVPVTSQEKDPESERKRLFSLLLEGRALVIIDNVSRTLESDALCSILTEAVFTDRQLGASRTVEVPTTTLFIATGNNIQVAGDITTRVLVCRIDPEMEWPDKRKFNVDLRVQVPALRGKLVPAALTIIRAYLAAGTPEVKGDTFGRFEDWSAWCRAPLIWLGTADPCDTRAMVEKRDDVRETLSALLQAWHGVHGQKAATVAETVSEAFGFENAPDKEDDGARIAREERRENKSVLKDILRNIAPEGREGVNTRSLGRFISRYAGRIEGGLRIVESGKIHNVVSWQVATVDKKASVGEEKIQV